MEFNSGFKGLTEIELFDEKYSKFLQGWKHIKPQLLTSLSQIQRDVKLDRPLKKIGIYKNLKNV